MLIISSSDICARYGEIIAGIINKKAYVEQLIGYEYLFDPTIKEIGKLPYREFHTKRVEDKGIDPNEEILA